MACHRRVLADVKMDVMQVTDEYARRFEEQRQRAAACRTPRIVKEYDKGIQTGDFLCTSCGAVLDQEERETHGRPPLHPLSSPHS